MTEKTAREAGPPSQGTWSIDENLIAEIARQAATEVAGVVGVTEAGLMDRLSGHVGGSRAEIRGGRVHLALTVIIEYGRILPDLAEEIRGRVAGAVESMTGYRVSAVDVTVAELHVPGEPLPGREPGTGTSAGGRIDF